MNSREKQVDERVRQAGEGSRKKEAGVITGIGTWWGNQRLSLTL